MESTPSELDVDDPYKLALLLRYQMAPAAYIKWVDKQLFTLLESPVRPDESRLDKLVSNIQDLRARYSRDDLVKTIARASTLEQDITRFHNELKFLWLESQGQEQPVREVSAIFSSEERVPLKKAIIDCIANDPRHCGEAASLRGYDASYFMNELQEVIDRWPDDPARDKFLRLLHEIGHHSRELPSTYYLRADSLIPTIPIPPIEHGEAYTYCAHLQQRPVAIRVTKFPPDANGRSDQEKCYEVLAREIIIWSQLQHDNILFLKGLLHPGEVPGHFPIPYRDTPWIVSEWQPHGDAFTFLKTHPGPPKIIDLIMGTAAALNYLHNHTPAIIHGDVKPENVLVSSEGKALLCDFGRARFCHRPQRTISHPSPGGTRRYQAPELSAPVYLRSTKATDIYSFAMLIFCLASGDHPFAASHDTYIMHRVLEGYRPSNPNTGIFSHANGASLFELLQIMWHDKPSNRPTITLAENHLRKVFHDWKG